MDDGTAEFQYTIQFGNNLWQSGKLADAWGMFLRAFRLKPWNPPLVFHIGALFHQQGEYEKAIHWYSIAATQGRSDPSLLNNLGEAFRSLGKYQEAQRCFLKGLEVNPNLAQLHNNLGLVQYALGDLPGAESSFRRAISLLSDYPKAQRNLARVLQDQGKRIEASLHFAQSRAKTIWPPRQGSSSSSP